MHVAPPPPHALCWLSEFVKLSLSLSAVDLHPPPTPLLEQSVLSFLLASSLYHVFVPLPSFSGQILNLTLQ